MNISRMKWISTLLTTLFIAAFEFVRHQFLHFISMDWGNLMVAGFAGVLFFFYFHGLFILLETAYNKLQQEREETAVLQERDRIARQLHDNIAQALFFMNVKVNEAENALQQDHKPLLEIAELKEAIKMTDADIRQHIFTLQKVTQNNIDLAAAIQNHLIQFKNQSGMEVEIQSDGDINTLLNRSVKNRLFQIFQELLLNIRKHAGANKVSIAITNDGKRFLMTIRDNGKGFDPKNIQTNHASFGYKNLEEDVQAIGAKIELHSLPGQGTEATVRLQLAKGVNHS